MIPSRLSAGVTYCRYVAQLEALRRAGRDAGKRCETQGTLGVDQREPELDTSSSSCDCDSEIFFPTAASAGGMLLLTRRQIYVCSCVHGVNLRGGASTVE